MHINCQIENNLRFALTTVIFISHNKMTLTYVVFVNAYEIIENV